MAPKKKAAAEKPAADTADKTEKAASPAAAADTTTEKTAEKGTDTTGDADKNARSRPEKPDEDVFKAALAEAEKVHKAVMDKLTAVKQKLEGAQPSKEAQTPQQRRREELRAELKSIREQQSQHKSSRGNSQEKISSLDAQLKSRMAEQKAAKARVPYKSVEDVDREIDRLNKQVESGTMKIVDEKKALNEVSNLNRMKKSFAGFEETETQIQNVKQQISDLKKGMDNPEQKALSERYNAITKELDSMKADQDGVYKNLNSLRDERSSLQEEQRKTWAGIREVKDNYYAARNAFRDWEGEARRQRALKHREEREHFNKEKRRAVAAEKRDAASQPAFMDEILSAEGLIRHFDPSAAPTETRALREPSKLGAQAQRTVDASNMKGTALKKKGEEEELYFVGSGGKKGKKGKKGAAEAEGGKFQLNIGVIEELSKVGVDPPSTQADVPAVVEKLQAKVKQWKENQEQKTKENVAKAQAEIDKLEAEAAAEDAAAASNAASGSNPHHHHAGKGGRAHDNSKKPAQANAGVNGHADADAQLKQEKDAKRDVAEELKAATLEDAKA